MNVLKPERRLMLVAIREHDVLDYFTFGMTADVPAFLSVPVVDPPLPAGVSVLRVWHDAYHRVFNFVVSHPSFPEVPDGQILPTVGFGQPLAVRRKGFMLATENGRPIPTADADEPTTTLRSDDS